MLSAGAVCLFLLAGGWTIRAGNQGTWDWPGPKLPPEAIQADQVGQSLKDNGYQPSHGRVLLDPRMAVWLTVSHPDIRLIMPGHGFPITFSTTLPAQEYGERMELMQAWRKLDNQQRSERLSFLVKKYEVIEF